MGQTSPGGGYREERGIGVGTIVAVVVVIALVALLVWGFALGGFAGGTAVPGDPGTTGTMATPAAPGATPAAPGADQPAKAPLGGAASGGGTAPTKP